MGLVREVCGGESESESGEMESESVKMERDGEWVEGMTVMILVFPML